WSTSAEACSAAVVSAGPRLPERERAANAISSALCCTIHATAVSSEGSRRIQMRWPWSLRASA
ncbi:hypothetical protein, partial [Clavibacter michiganensis]|uniref:hypothetical protein n=1 Tax=Clavibacter michiganensis TaxID=28447 RepID=UPI001C20B325